MEGDTRGFDRMFLLAFRNPVNAAEPIGPAWLAQVMQKVTLDEIVGTEQYEKIRDDFRRRIIELKKHRRVPVGDHITLVFENHETVLFQVQEMLYPAQNQTYAKFQPAGRNYHHLCCGLDLGGRTSCSPVHQLAICPSRRLSTSSLGGVCP